MSNQWQQWLNGWNEQRFYILWSSNGRRFPQAIQCRLSSSWKRAVEQLSLKKNYHFKVQMQQACLGNFDEAWRVHMLPRNEPCEGESRGSRHVQQRFHDKWREMVSHSPAVFGYSDQLRLLGSIPDQASRNRWFATNESPDSIPLSGATCVHVTENYGKLGKGTIMTYPRGRGREYFGTISGQLRGAGNWVKFLFRAGWNCSKILPGGWNCSKIPGGWKTSSIGGGRSRNGTSQVITSSCQFAVWRFQRRPKRFQVSVWASQQSLFTVGSFQSDKCPVFWTYKLVGAGGCFHQNDSTSESE